MSSNVKIKKYVPLFILLVFILANSKFGIGTVQTESMEPEIKPGSVIFYEKNIDIDKLVSEDIILFKNGDRLICHRLLRSDKEYIYTKGDNNDEQDPPIERKNIVGKLIWHS